MLLKEELSLFCGAPPNDVTKSVMKESLDLLLLLSWVAQPFCQSGAGLVLRISFKMLEPT